MLRRIKDKKEAEQIYKNQVDGMKRLAQHKDFDVLLEYWQREYDGLDMKLDTLRGQELDDAVRERRMIRRHLTFIRSLTE